MCGNCCYGEGGIFMTGEETERIARFLDMGSQAFLEKYCEARNGRTYIRAGRDNFCVFYDKEKSCLIHPAKPNRCELWPYYPAITGDRQNWELAKEACPGISSDCSFEEFVTQSHTGEKENGSKAEKK
jgi:uncharacterized protein